MHARSAAYSLQGHRGSGWEVERSVSSIEVDTFHIHGGHAYTPIPLITMACKLDRFQVCTCTGRVVDRPLLLLLLSKL